MSNRTVKKLRHRTDIADIPSFSERMLAGQNGESMCKNPHCRKFAKTHMPDGKHCQYCYVVPSVAPPEEHVHSADCKHGDVEHGVDAHEPTAEDSVEI